MKTQNKTTGIEVSEEKAYISKKPHRVESTGKPDGYTPLKLAQLLEHEQKYNTQCDTVTSSHLMPHRPENIGHPIGLPTLKLSDLLQEEPENTDSEEIDTGPPVGNEVW